MHIANEGKGNGRLVSVGLYKGASDLIFTWKGKTICCEVKTATGVLSMAQENFAIHAIESGWEYHVVRSVDEFKKLINELDN